MATILDSTGAVSKQRAGEATAVSKVMKFGEKSVVVKKYNDVKSSKWVMLGVWAPTANFVTQPLARLYREYNALRKLRAIGIKTPRVIAVSLSERVLVREFAEGTPISKSVKKILGGKDIEFDHENIRSFTCSPSKNALCWICSW